MPIRITATRLRTQLFRTLDQVLATGDPVEIQRPGGSVRIVSDTAARRLASLTPHPGTINGNADDLASLSWEQAWKPNL
jgi:hypothetical protein